MVLRWLKVKIFLISFRIWPARASPSPSQCCRLRTAHSQAGGDNIRHPSRKIKQVYNWILCCMIFFYFLLHQAMGQQLFKLNHCFVGERGGGGLAFLKIFLPQGYVSLPSLSFTLPITQWSFSASGSLWEMPDSNPDLCPLKSGAILMSHHIS